MGSCLIDCRHKNQMRLCFSEVFFMLFPNMRICKSFFTKIKNKKSYDHLKLISLYVLVKNKKGNFLLILFFS